MKKNRSLIVSAFSMLLVMVVFFIYANSERELALGKIILKKSNDLKLPESREQDESKKTDITDKSPSISSAQTKIQKPLDTASKRILLIGDSQAEGLMYPLNDYCVSSGHELVYVLSWYSARDATFASTDTLNNLIRVVNPDYIIMVIGLNQLLQKSSKKSIESVEKIKKMFGNIPYAWIGPANWTDDFGINDAYQKSVDTDAFFLTRGLNLPRGADGRHPNNTGYRIWMDSIAQWLNSDARWRIKMIKPKKTYVKRKFKFRVLRVGRVANTNIDTTPAQTVLGRDSAAKSRDSTSR